ncbi:Sec-independent protein translocase subunit TatA [Aurantivibrio plasticivorans]
MGIGGISIWQLLIILAIVVMIFGTKRLKNIGGDLGSAIRGFKKGLNDEDKPAVEEKTDDATNEKVISGEAEKVEKD